MRNGGPCDAGENLHEALKIVGRDIHLEADHSLRAQGTLEKQGDLLDLLLLPWILEGFTIGDELGVRLKKLFNNPKLIGPDRAPRLGHLHNGIRQTLDNLPLRCSPGELHIHLDLLVGEVVAW